MLINVLTISSLIIMDSHVEGRWPSLLEGIQMMVDVHRGDELVCFSISSLMEHLEDFLILFLEELILHRYLVVLSL